MNRPSFEIKNDARLIVKTAIFQVMLTTLVYLVIQYLMNVLVAGLSGYTAFIDQNYNLIMSGKPLETLRWPRVDRVALALAAAVGFMTRVLEAGYSRYVLLLSRGERAGVRAIVDAFAHFGKIVVIQLLTGAAVCVGFVFFIVPGFVLAHRYRLSLFVLYDDPTLGPVQCMRRSAQLMRGNKVRRFMLDLSFIGWIILSNIISALLLPVLELWLSPYMGVAGAVFYNDLVGIRSKAPEQPQPPNDGNIDE